MNVIEIVNGPMSHAMADVTKTPFQITMEWINRSINLIKLIPDHLQKNPQHALGVFVTANAISFYFINRLAHYLEERVASAPKQLDVDEKRFNQVLIYGFVVGGSVLIFNLALSRLLSYTLTKMTLAAITAASIALRFILSNIFPAEE